MVIWVLFVCLFLLPKDNCAMKENGNRNLVSFTGRQFM